jgi:hypothetical protein
MHDNRSHQPGEDVRRVMEVLRSDAHIDLETCGECLISFQDITNVMRAYTTRMLSPADTIIQPGTLGSVHQDMLEFLR